jgi:hypothetical protein
VVVVSDTNRLAYELSRSALTDQSERVSDLRTRAGTILAAASIAGSFLGVTNGGIDTLAALALLAYLVSVGAAVSTLLPHRLATEFRGRRCCASHRRSVRPTTRRTRQPSAGSSASGVPTSAFSTG